MSSRASCFSISMPLVQENLRRFWAIPVISFLVYFLSGVFPILMGYSHIDNMAGFIQSALDNMHPFFMAMHLLIPVVTAVILFRYLQTPAAVTSVHAMPFTRGKLFISNTVSGLIMVLLPILATGLILLLIAKPAYPHEAYDYDSFGNVLGLASHAVNVFNRPDILMWMWESFIIVLVIYSVAVFAGMVSGNSIMHLLSGFGYCFLIPGLLTIVVSVFCQEYLYGFDSGNWEEIIISLSPFLRAFEQNGFPWQLQCFYFATALALLGVSFLLYYKRKLERAADSLVFGFMVPVISYLIAFFGMVLLGFYFRSLGNSDAYMYVGFFVGALIFFLIGRMIVKKTPRIFNGSTAKNFAIYLVLAALFVSVFTFDITGYAARVPAPSQVKSVALRDSLVFGNNFYYAKSSENLSLEELTDPQNIESALAFHRDLLTQKDLWEAEYGRGTYTPFATSIHLEYGMGKLFPMKRYYTSIPYVYLRNSKELAQIFESDEFKNKMNLDGLKQETRMELTLRDPFDLGKSVAVSGKNALNALLDCLTRDFREQTYAEATDLRYSYANIDVSYGNNHQYMRIAIPYSYENTLRWLKEEGYAKQFEVTPEMVDQIRVYKTDQEGYPDEKAYYSSSQVWPTQDDAPASVIMDKEQIRWFLENGQRNQDEYGGYSFRIIFIPDYERYNTEAAGYLNEKDAPDFLRAAFE